MNYLIALAVFIPYLLIGIVVSIPLTRGLVFILNLDPTAIGRAELLWAVFVWPCMLIVLSFGLLCIQPIKWVGFLGDKLYEKWYR